MLIRCNVSEMLAVTVDAKKKFRLIKKNAVLVQSYQLPRKKNGFEGGVRGAGTQVIFYGSAVKKVMQACR